MVKFNDMNLDNFYKIYIPALEKALENDNINYGFYVRDPSDYIQCSSDELRQIDLFLDKISGKNKFLDMVAYYFDAKSHNFPSIENVDINLYKQNILFQIRTLKEEYHL